MRFVRRLRRPAAALLATALLFTLTGCWDKRELDNLFIVTGVALDTSLYPEQMDITLQIGKTNGGGANANKQKAEDDPFILYNTTANTVLEGLSAFNRDSSRSLLLQHNQVILLGDTLAAQGVSDRIDMFLRSQEGRMEVLVMVTEGRARDVLGARLAQEDNTGLFIASLMEDLYEASPHYKIRVLDFVSRLREGTTSPVAPILILREDNGRQELGIDGMAVFKGGQMVGKLSVHAAAGYIWAMGDVTRHNVVIDTEEGRAVLRILRLDTKRAVHLLPEGKVQIALTINAKLAIGELRGFKDMEPKELMPYLVATAKEQITKQIMETFRVAQTMDTDIYGFEALLRRTHPRAFRKMEDKRGLLFREMELSVDTRIRLPYAGQIIKSVEMEDERP